MPSLANNPAENLKIHAMPILNMTREFTSATCKMTAKFDQKWLFQMALWKKYTLPCGVELVISLRHLMLLQPHLQMVSPHGDITA